MEAKSIDFHRRVRKMFLEVHTYYPSPVITVDASGDPDTVYELVLKGLTGVAL